GNRRSYNDGALLYYHTGIDYGVCADLNIYATAKGIVVYADESIIRGNTIIIDHGWGVYTVYCHLSEFHATVGDKVEQGQLIALIGSTGRATGPHLHFEIRVNGTAVNPLTWLGKTFP
ncbi:MAG: M23 family metallopeptidase, partial [Clostridiales bacterium]|nr:M23 family metallopeptidase [Clostridiales bacterium]